MALDAPFHANEGVLLITDHHRVINADALGDGQGITSRDDAGGAVGEQFLLFVGAFGMCHAFGQDVPVGPVDRADVGRLDMVDEAAREGWRAGGIRLRAGR